MALHVLKHNWGRILPKTDMIGARLLKIWDKYFSYFILGLVQTNYLAYDEIKYSERNL